MEEEQSSEPAPVEEMEVAVEEEDDELNVVSGTDYVPRTAAMAAGQRAPQLMYDPTSGRNIPVDQISEHMRIQLMDPKWMEQQKRFHDKQQDTSFATGSSIADSLKGFAKARGDIFGSSSDGNSLLTPEEAERKKRVLEEGRKESDLGGLPVRSESDDLQSVQESNARAAAAVSKPQPPVPAPPPAPTPTSTQALPAPPPAPLPRASSQPMPPPPPQFQHTHTMPLQHMGMQPPQMGMQQVIFDASTKYRRVDVNADDFISHTYL